MQWYEPRSSVKKRRCIWVKITRIRNVARQNKEDGGEIKRGIGVFSKAERWLGEREGSSVRKSHTVRWKDLIISSTNLIER